MQILGAVSATYSKIWQPDIKVIVIVLFTSNGMLVESSSTACHGHSCKAIQATLQIISANENSDFFNFVFLRWRIRSYDILMYIFMIHSSLWPRIEQLLLGDAENILAMSVYGGGDFEGLTGNNISVWTIPINKLGHRRNWVCKCQPRHGVKINSAV